MTTPELCAFCENPTGKAGRDDDSLYEGEHGPFCETCWATWTIAQAAALRGLVDDIVEGIAKK